MEKIKILIVDDILEVGLFMKKLLTREAPHFDVDSVPSGFDCIERIKTDPPDCILSDYQMPDMDGMTLLRTVKAAGSDTPFIFLTSHGSEEVAREAFKNGAFDYFTREAGKLKAARIVNSVEQAVRQRDLERSRRRAEEALRESESKFRNLVEGSMMGVVIVQGERFLYANPGYAGMVGYTADELVNGASVLDVVYPDDRPLVRENIRKRMSGEVKAIRYQFRMLAKDGGVVHVESYGARTVYEGKPAVVASIMDITDRMRAEEAVRKSNSLLGAISLAQSRFIEDADTSILFEQLLDGVVSLTESKHGVIVEVSPGQGGGHALKVMACHGLSKYKDARGDCRGDILGLFDSALETGKPVTGVVPDGGQDETVADGGISPGAPYMVVPFMRGGRPVGAALVANRAGGYDEDSLDFLGPFISTCANIIEAHKNENALRAKYLELYALNSVAEIVGGSEGLDEKLKLALDKTLSLTFLGIEKKGVIFIRDENDPDYLRMAANIGIAPELVEIEKRIRLGVCLCGKAAQTGEALRSDDCFDDAGHTTRYPGMTRHGHIVVPIKSGDKTHGVMTFYLAPGQHASDTEERLLTAVANQLAVAIENHRLFERISSGKREWEETFDAMAELVTINSPDLKIIRANRSVERALGVRLEDIVSKRWAGVFAPKRGDERVAAVMEALTGPNRGALPSVETSVKSRAGDERTIAWRFAALNGADGALGAVIATGEDVTERRRLEEQLRQSQKMEAVGHLAGGIAHDFNNITAAVIACGSVLQGKVAQSDPARIYVDQILASAERATALTQSLLAFSRKQIINPAPIDINDVIRRAEGLLSRLIGDDMVLQTRLAAGPLTVMADQSQLDQVTMNLVTNARDAMPDGGRIVVETARVDLTGGAYLSHGYAGPGRYAVFSVSDTGVGIDEATMGNVFEPFFTTKEVGKGTGLGLAIVYGIVKQHNGVIDVRSSPGAGATFRIYLPLVEAAPLNHALPDDAPPPGGPETILIAEDDSVFRSVMKDVLEERGYSVIAAVDGRDAVEKFEADMGDIDLVIIDVIMPRMNGKDAHEAMKRLDPGVKALFTSGYTDDIIHRKGVLDTSIDFIAKPATPDALLRKVREILDRKED